MAKQYGLILPNKSKLTPVNEIRKPSIFNEESDGEEDEEKPTGITKIIKRQDRVAIEKAVEEDPTVYQYDEVYDEIDQKRKDSKLSRKDLDKKPKYINRLLAAAEKRKRENERRIERQVQKERDAEGEEFKDKESFVTMAYRKKLEEFKKMEEEEKREEYLEKIGDVTKQGNLDGFYRHLYDQKVNFEDRENEEDKETKDEEDKETKDDKTSDESSCDDKKIKSIRRKTNNKRKYRKRESSNSEGDEKGNNEEGNNKKKLEHLQSNLDADSDFSIDSDSSDGEDLENNKLKKLKKDEDEIKIEGEIEKKGEEVINKIDGDEDVKKDEEEIEKKPKKPKIDIWKKRTVGVIFDEAVQRYFERKSLRGVVC